MKYSILLTLGFLMPTVLSAQLLNTSIRADNSVIYEGGAFGFDISDESISFDWYGNTSDAKPIDYITKNKETIWGVSASGSGSNKVLNLFNQGKPSTNGDFSFLLGHTWYAVKNRKQLSEKLNKLDAVDKQMNSQAREYERQCVRDLLLHFNGPVSSAYADVIETQWNKRKTYYTYLENNPGTAERQDAFLNILMNTIKTDPEPPIVTSAKGIIQGYIDRTTSSLSILNACRLEIIDEYMPLATVITHPTKYTFYGRTGGGVISIRNFTGVDTTMPFLKAFKSNTDFAPFLTLGFNIEKKKVTHGIFVERLWGNNFTSLSTTEYIARTISTSGTSSLTEEKKVTAYSKELEETEFWRFRYDFVIDLPLGDSNTLAVNPFIRHSIPSNDELSPKLTDLGISAYFYKNEDSKLFGGISLEFNDLFNNFQAFSEKELSDNPLERFSIIVTGKYLFGSFAPRFGKRIAEEVASIPE